MDNKDYIIALFQEGHLCNCKLEPTWDRVYDEENRFAGYELAHKVNCTGRIKASEIMKELEDENA